MDYQIFLLFLLFLWALIHMFISSKGSQSSKTNKLPLGPRPLPIIGNILELGSNPHHALTNLSKIYGPIMTLKLGKITTIVISSPGMAKDALHTNDLAFSSRTIPDSAFSLDHHKVSMVWSPASAKWRTLRRICATKVFSPQQLDSTQVLRHRKVQELLDYVRQCCQKGEAVDVGKAAFTTVLNSMSNTFFSMDLAHYTSDKCQELKDIVWGIMEEAGRPNIVDFFPILRRLDPQGARARMNNYLGKFLTFFDGLIEERMGLRASRRDSKNCDVLDSFLDLMEDSELSRLEVLHLFVDLFVAGTDTTSNTVEWAMAELIHNPNKLAKAKGELHQFLGNHGKLEESHISKLPFLQAVVKETLRMHPPAPFLVPHKSENDVEIGGFIVPKNAQILVNVWAMGRDPSIWNNPDSFVPERFLESEIEFKGRDFEFIPFGAGRRKCPGMPLADRTLHLILASLVHNFDWSPADGLKPKDMDLREKYGMTLKKALPLRAIPSFHNI